MSNLPTVNRNLNMLLMSVYPQLRELEIGFIAGLPLLGFSGPILYYLDPVNSLVMFSQTAGSYCSSSSRPVAADLP